MFSRPSRNFLSSRDTVLVLVGVSANQGWDGGRHEPAVSHQRVLKHSLSVAPLLRGSGTKAVKRSLKSSVEKKFQLRSSQSVSSQRLLRPSSIPNPGFQTYWSVVHESVSRGERFAIWERLHLFLVVSCLPNPTEFCRSAVCLCWLSSHCSGFSPFCK